MDREKLKKRLEEILEYEDHITEEWEAGIYDAEEMVEKALKKDPDNKWLHELHTNLIRAYETECALSDVKNLLESINDQSKSDEDIKHFEEELRWSIGVCERVVVIVGGDQNKIKEKEEELLKLLKELNAE
jgi:flagellar biosynthesis component FlhA